MQPIEIELTREFKQQQTEIEDFVMTDLSDMLTNFSNKKAEEKYKLVAEQCKKLQDLMNKMHDLKTFDVYLKEYDKQIEILSEILESIEQYFSTDKDFAQEASKLIIETLTPQLDKLQEIIIALNYLSYQRTANNLKFQFKKMNDVVNGFANKATSDVIYIYQLAKNDIIKKTIEMSQKKFKLYKELRSKYEDTHVEEIDKKDYKKIFDYKKLNKLIKGNGFEEVRQTGDHKIFSDGIKSIPIPQKTIGKGLSLKIQRQIDG